ncbi:MAG: 6-phosphogluconolactonase [Micrococcus sp.]|nr:6-phosphogluconolactonase [Micrococcus sp.]
MDHEFSAPGAEPVTVAPDRDELARRCADALLERIDEDLSALGRADVVLTGGSTGIAVIEALAAALRASERELSGLHLWWGDERWLPAGDAERNDQQAFDAGLAGLLAAPRPGDRPVLRREQVHPFASADAGLSLEEAARAMAAELAGVESFTVLMLGMGPDSHVASLFPEHPGLSAAGSDAVAVDDSPKPPPQRLSMTFECLSRAEQVWFTVTGADKAEAVAVVRALRSRGEYQPQHPASGVRARQGVMWWLDAFAADAIDA